MLTVILTGGGSRRMGRDKAMLPWQGGSMLQSLIDRYQCLGEVAVSVNEPGRFVFCNAFELVDCFPGMGPLNGIISAFSQTEAEAVFVTATDLPFGEPALAARLYVLLEDHDACVLKHGGKGAEPLFAVYSRSCLQSASELLSEGCKRFMELLNRIDVRYVTPDMLPDFDLDRILTNVNTREEYAASLARE